MSIPAFPLQWPDGWKRTGAAYRTHGRFTKKAQAPGRSYATQRELTINEAVIRLRDELQRMGIADHNVVINTNLVLRLDGYPRSDQREPADPGAVAYWRDDSSNTRCMAIDRYVRVADNIAALAATIEAMRAIERHGGAEILNRAFTGFTAIEDQRKPWHVVLAVAPLASVDLVRAAYRRARSVAHPDTPGGDTESFDAVQKAWDTFCRERGVDHG